MNTRIYLAGHVGLEHEERLVIDEGQFRGRQARTAFAYLVCNRTRPVPREELAAAVWGNGHPPAWDSALAAIMSRLRGLLAVTPLHPDMASISSRFGQYELRLPADTWVDIEEATVALDKAEGALRLGDPGTAFGPATVAAAIARRPFLSGDNGRWAESQRDKLRRQLLRALDCLALVWLAADEPHLTVEAASEAVSLDPFRESSYQLLMRAHGASRNRPEAVKVYHRLRGLLAEELGTDPSEETQALYLQMLS